MSASSLVAIGAAKIPDARKASGSVASQSKNIAPGRIQPIVCPDSPGQIPDLHQHVLGEQRHQLARVELCRGIVADGRHLYDACMTRSNAPSRLNSSGSRSKVNSQRRCGSSRG